MAEGNFTKVDGDILFGSEVNNQTGNFITVEAGEALVAGNVVFIYGSGHANEGEAWLSDANVQNKNRAHGICVTAAADGADVVVQTSGVYKEAAAFTDKKVYYLSATAGAFTTTASGVKLGVALGTGELFLDIVQDDKDVVGTIKPWHKSATGMPSNMLTAFWKECDGAAFADAESPLSFANLPDLNSTQRFIRGSTTSGTTGGSDTHTHTFNTGDHFGQVGDVQANGPVTDAGGVNKMNIPDPANASSVPAHLEMVWVIKVK